MRLLLLTLLVTTWTYAYSISILTYLCSMWRFCPLFDPQSYNVRRTFTHSMIASVCRNYTRLQFGGMYTVRIGTMRNKLKARAFTFEFTSSPVRTRCVRLSSTLKCTACGTCTRRRTSLINYCLPAVARNALFMEGSATFDVTIEANRC